MTVHRIMIMVIDIESVQFTPKNNRMDKKFFLFYTKVLIKYAD